MRNRPVPSIPAESISVAELMAWITAREAELRARVVHLRVYAHMRIDNHEISHLNNIRAAVEDAMNGVRHIPLFNSIEDRLGRQVEERAGRKFNSVEEYTAAMTLEENALCDNLEYAMDAVERLADQACE